MVLDKACQLINTYMSTTEQHHETVGNYLPPDILRDGCFTQFKQKLQQFDAEIICEVL